MKSQSPSPVTKVTGLSHLTQENIKLEKFLKQWVGIPLYKCFISHSFAVMVQKVWTWVYEEYMIVYFKRATAENNKNLRLDT